MEYQCLKSGKATGETPPIASIIGQTLNIPVNFVILKDLTLDLH